MPSIKQPASIVQPGPGRLSAGSVSASALNFDVFSSPRLASTIYTSPFDGETWDLPATDLQSALNKAYEGLNARGIWVLDATPSTTADFSGSSALRDAVDAWRAASSNSKPVLFLRPGTYSWSRQSNFELDDITIVGARVTDTIITTAGDPSIYYFSVARRTRLMNLTINAPAFRFPEVGTEGGGVLDNVKVNAPILDVASDLHRISNTSFPTVTTVTVSGDSNVFDRVDIRPTTSFTVSGAYNVFRDSRLERLQFISVASSDSSKCSLENIVSTTSVTVALSSHSHSFKNVTASQLILNGGSNTVNRLTLVGTQTTPATAILHFGGANNAVTNVTIGTGAAKTVTSPIVNFAADHNTLRDVSMYSFSTTAALLLLQLDHCTVDHVLFSNCNVTDPGVGLVQSPIHVSGSNNIVTNVEATNGSAFDNFCFVSGTANTVSNVDITGTSVGVFSAYIYGYGDNNTFDRWRVTNVPALLKTVVKFESKGNVARQLRIGEPGPTITQVTNVPLVRFASATNCSVSDVVIQNIASPTTGGGLAGFQVARFETSTQCSLGEVTFTGSATLPTTTPLFYMTGCKACVIDGVYASTLGATQAIAAPMFGDASATVNTSCVIRNVAVDSTYVTTARIISINSTLWHELTMDSVNCVVSTAAQNVVYIIGLNNSSSLTISNSNFSNTNTAASHTVYLNQGCGVHLKNCTVSSENVWALGTDVAAIFATECRGTTTLTGCTFSGQMAARLAEVTATDCRFIGASTASTPGAPLVRAFTTSMTGCVFTVGPSNVKTAAASTTPILLFGAGCILKALKVNDTGTLTAWHSGTTVAMNNWGVGSQTVNSIDGLEIQVKGWDITGAGCSAFNQYLDADGLGLNSAVFEAIGQSDDDGVFNEALVRNLKITGVVARGSGARHVIKASACVFDGVSIDGDGTTTASPAPWTQPLVLVRSSVLRNLRMFTVGTFGITGSNPYVKALGGTIADSTFTNINIGANPPTAVIEADGARVRNCSFPIGTYTGMTSVVRLNTNASCEGCSFTANGSSMPGSGLVYVTGANSQVNNNTFSGSVGSSGLSLIYSTGIDTHISDNDAKVSITPASYTSNYPMIHVAGRGAVVSNNHLSSGSTAMFYIAVNANQCVVSGNRIDLLYADSTASGFTYGSAIRVNGSFNTVEGNTLYNGSNTSFWANLSIRVNSGLGNTISGNTLSGDSTTKITAYMGIITIDSSGGNIITGNTIPRGANAHAIHSGDTVNDQDVEACARARFALANAMALTKNPTQPAVTVGEFYTTTDNTGTHVAGFHHAVGTAHLIKSYHDDNWATYALDSLPGGRMNGCFYSHGNLVMYGKTSGGAGAIQTSLISDGTNTARTVSGTSSEFVAGVRNPGNTRVLAIDTQGRVFTSSSDSGSGTWSLRSTVAVSSGTIDMACGYLGGIAHHAVTEYVSKKFAVSVDDAANWTNYVLPFSPHAMVYDSGIELFVVSGVDTEPRAGLWLVDGNGLSHQVYRAPATGTTEGYWLSLAPGGYMMWPGDDNSPVVFFDGYRAHRMLRPIRGPSTAVAAHAPVKFQVAGYPTVWTYFCDNPVSTEMVCVSV